MTNSIVSPIGLLLRESLSDIFRYVMENDVDPVTSGIVLNTSNVKTVTALGRADLAGTKAGMFSAQHPLVFGRAGLIQYANIGQTLGMDAPPRLAKTMVYPNATKVPQRSSEWLSIPLKWLQGNLTIDRLQWLALTSGQPIEDFLADWLKDPIELVRTQMTTDFFGNGKAKLGTVQSGDPSNIANTTEVTFEVTGSCRPFWRGQRFVIYGTTIGSGRCLAVTGGTTDACVFVVTKVYSYTGGTYQKIVAKYEGGLSGATGNTETESSPGTMTLHLVGGISMDGATGYGVQGLDNFVLSATQTADKSYHGLSVYTHSGTVWHYPELISYEDLSATLRWPTPIIFERAADVINDRGFQGPSKWLTTRGVRTNYYYGEGLWKTYNTDLGGGAQRGADGGISGNPRVTTEREVWDVVPSAFCPKNTAYGIRPESFVRYAPKGVDAIQFLAESDLLGNGGSPFFLSVDPTTGGRTSVYEAPFDTFVEMGCLAPQSLAKITGLKELVDVI